MIHRRCSQCRNLFAVSPLIIAGWALGPAGADTTLPVVPLHLKGVILTPAGKPATDAAIVYALIDYRAQAVAQEQVLHPASDGTFDIAWTPSRDNPQEPVLYVAAPEGVALPSFGFSRSGPLPMTVTLIPATRVRVRLRDEAGLPLAGVRISAQTLIKDHEYSHWNEAVTDYLSAVTDANGTATLAGLPQGWTLRLVVTGSGWVQPDWSQNIALASAAVTPDAAVQVAHGGSLSGVVMYGPAQPAAQVVVTAVPLGDGGGRQDGTTDSTGHYQITGMPRGSYTVSIEGSQSRVWPPKPWEWTAATQPAVIVPGGDVAGVSFTLIHGGIVSGAVTDIKTSKPISGADIYVDGPGGGQNARTDDAGRYSLHVPPGGQRVFLEAAPGMKSADPKSVVVADGQTQTADFQSTMPLRPMPVHGLVVGPTGTPVAGAKVIAAGQSQQEQDAQQTTDAGGRFTFDAPGLLPDMRLYAARGGLSTPVGVAAADGDGGKPVMLRLALHADLTVAGRVVSADGRPVAGASATLYREYVSDGTGTGVATAKTNAAGQYMFTPSVPDATYSVGVQADGFGFQITKQSLATGPLLHFAPLALPCTDSFVGGTVLDVSGRPIAGADVSLEGAGDKHTQTDAEGRFHLAGATRGKAILEVRAAQGRYASIQEPSGRNDLQITAMNTDEQMVEGKRFTAALDADKSNHGDGTDAHALLRSACAQASAGNKNVLLVFHASWCGPCFLLHRFLEDPQVKPVMDTHFVVQDIDIWENVPHKDWGNPGGESLYKQYGGVRPSGDKQGVPFFAVLTPAGASLGDARLNGDNIGYPSDPASATFFLKTLKRAAPDLTDADIAILKAGLQRNAKI